MKNFFQLREELSQLNEMEMLTHKKKIAAAKQKVTDLHHDFTKAAEHHFKQADAMAKKHDPDHPKTKMHRTIGGHLADTAYSLRDGAKMDKHSDHYIKKAHSHSNMGNNLAKEYGSGKSKHSIQGMATHTSKLHKALSSALSAHQDAIKNSPAGKVKTAVNKIKSKLTNEAVDQKGNKVMKTFFQLREELSQLDELKIGTYQSYMKKANKQIKQYNTKKYQDAFYKQHGSAAKHGSPDFQRYKKAYADDSRRIGNREKGTDRAMTAINRKRDATGKNPERYYTKAMRKADADKQPKTRGRPRSLSYGYTKPEV